MEVRRQVQDVWRGLTTRERRVLRTFARSSPDASARVHAKIILSLVQDKSPTEIHRGGLCSVSQVYRVANRFVEHGLSGLADRREDNGVSKASEEYEWHLLIAVAKQPKDYGFRRPTWTQELLALALEKVTGIKVSCTTISRLLKRNRVRLGRPKPIVGCPWKKARRMRRLREIRRMLDTLPSDEVAVYLDEVDIHLNPKIGADWMLRGMQKTVLTPGKNQKRYLAGSLNAKTGRLTWVEAERKTSDLFIAMLWQLLKDYPDAKCIHVVLDNFKIHSSVRTKFALAKVGPRIKLHFLPPYCPDHNKIERVWKDLHDNVTRNHTCRTMVQLMEEVYAYLRQRRRALRHEYVRCAA
jgi:transposase